MAESKEAEPLTVPEDVQPVLCRLCKGQGWYFRPQARHESETMPCEVCKGQGQLHPADVDEWTFADLDEDLGPGAMGAQRGRTPYVPRNAEWRTWVDEEDGRGYLWAELRVLDAGGGGGEAGGCNSRKRKK